MKSENGIQLFAKGDQLPPLPAGLTGDVPVTSRFGFKICEYDGKACWEAATEENFRESEAQRLAIESTAVTIPLRCQQTGPQDCVGVCHLEVCSLAYNPEGRYYYCTCA